MINLFPKLKYSRGAATLIFAVILIVICTMIVFFAANFSRMQDTTVANQVRQTQAFEAAEAGIEFGIAYLEENNTTILANPVNGFINYTNASLTNVALGNGSSFSVTYTNPVANNYNLVQITSTGRNDDNTAVKVITQQVQFGSLLVTSPTATITSKGSVSMTGNGGVTNTTNNTTIISGSTVGMSGSAKTTTASGVSSTPGNYGADIQQNNNAISSQSNDDFFASFFGTTDTSAIQNQFSNVYTNSQSTNYAGTLNGMEGTTVWINQTGSSVANFSGNSTIGTAQNPVLMVVNGPLNVTGNVTIYGFVFVIGPSGIANLTGNINVVGGMVTTDDLTITGNADVIFNPTVLNNIRNNPSTRYYAKVPGSWKDF